MSTSQIPTEYLQVLEIIRSELRKQGIELPDRVYENAVRNAETLRSIYVGVRSRPTVAIIAGLLAAVRVECYPRSLRRHILAALSRGGIETYWGVRKFAEKLMDDENVFEVKKGRCREMIHQLVSRYGICRELPDSVIDELFDLFLRYTLNTIYTSMALTYVLTNLTMGDIASMYGATINMVMRALRKLRLRGIKAVKPDSCDELNRLVSELLVRSGRA